MIVACKLKNRLYLSTIDAGYTYSVQIHRNTLNMFVTFHLAFLLFICFQPTGLFLSQFNTGVNQPLQTGLFLSQFNTGLYTISPNTPL